MKHHIIIFLLLFGIVPSFLFSSFPTSCHLHWIVSFVSEIVPRITEDMKQKNISALSEVYGKRVSINIVLTSPSPEVLFSWDNSGTGEIIRQDNAFHKRIKLHLINTFIHYMTLSYAPLTFGTFFRLFSFRWMKIIKFIIFYSLDNHGLNRRCKFLCDNRLRLWYSGSHITYYMLHILL